MQCLNGSSINVNKDSRTPTLHLLVEKIETLHNTLEKLGEASLHDNVRPIVPHLIRHLRQAFDFSKEQTPMELMALALNPAIVYMRFEENSQEWSKLASHVTEGLELLREYPIDALIGEVETTYTQSQSHDSTSCLSQLPPRPKKDARLSIASEVDHYLHLADISTFTSDDDRQLLKWWRNRQDRLPILSRIALRILSIPASQHAHFVTEGLFSKLRSHITESSPSDVGPESERKLRALRAFCASHVASNGQEKDKDGSVRVSKEELDVMREDMKVNRRRKDEERRIRYSELASRIQEQQREEHESGDEKSNDEQEEGDMEFGSDSESSEYALASESYDSDEYDDDNEEDFQPPLAKQPKLAENSTPNRHE